MSVDQTGDAVRAHDGAGDQLEALSNMFLDEAEFVQGAVTDGLGNPLEDDAWITFEDVSITLEGPSAHAVGEFLTLAGNRARQVARQREQDRNTRATPATPAPSDAGEVERLAELSAKATSGEWRLGDLDNHGNSPSDTWKDYSVEVGEGYGRTVLDTLNSDVAEISEELDEFGRYAWNEQGKRDLSFIIALVNAYRAGLLVPRSTPPASPVAEETWRPIDDSYVPEDRKSVLISWTSHDQRTVVGEAEWRQGEGEHRPAGWWWSNTDEEYGDVILPAPTHWRPLPSPPRAIQPDGAEIYDETKELNYPRRRLRPRLTRGERDG
jgi:hypothetical protein